VRWQLAEVDLTGAATETALIERLRAVLTQSASNADGRPVAVRIRLLGATDLFNLIEGRPQRLMQTVLEIAGETAGDDLWIEKVQNGTTPLEASSTVPDDTATDLTPILDEIAAKPQAIADALGAELGALRAKLPEDLKGLDAFNPLNDTDALHDALLKLKPRLRARLIGEDQAS
jgi:hypothetical protein